MAKISAMDRRTAFATLLCLPLGQLAHAEAPADEEDTGDGLPKYKVSLATLQAAVAQRFPFRYPVPGLVNLDVEEPRLRLLPAQNRLGAEAQVEAAGPALNRSHQGLLDVEFALRYEASDRTVRVTQLRPKRLQFPTLPPSANALINAYGAALAERTLLEVMVHRMRPQDLALPDGLGMQPGSITVTESGLTIGFVPKPL